MNLCVIPARGGSKRIPKKNVKPFHGRPMLAWSIGAARESDCFEHVIVSTDDEEIAATAKEWGAEVPFERPDELADDHTPTVPVVAHAVEVAEQLWGEVDRVCCLYATAPFVRAADIRAAKELLETSGAQFSMPVTSFPFPVQRGVHLQSSGRIEMISPEHANTRSQDLPEAFHDVGQFYWGRREAWLSGLTIMAPHTAAITIPRHRSQDIDTIEDWTMAEILFETLQHR